MTTCKGPRCRRPIYWVRLDSSGRPHPVEVEPSAQGAIGIIEPARRGRLALAVVLSRASCATWKGDLYVTHYATCPDAEAFRQRSET